MTPTPPTTLPNHVIYRRSLSSIINLAPQPQTVGRALSEVIKAHPPLETLVLVYRGDAELLLLQYFARDLLRSGAVLLEMKTNAKMSEQLSIGSFSFSTTLLERLMCLS